MVGCDEQDGAVSAAFLRLQFAWRAGGLACWLTGSVGYVLFPRRMERTLGYGISVCIITSSGVRRPHWRSACYRVVGKTLEWIHCIHVQ